MTPTAISAFARMTALSARNDDPEHASRPFDADRDGFVMGEGAAALVLERWDRAVARGAHIYGEVVGYGRNADAYHITAPSPGGEGAAACMQLALDDAGLSPADIGHVNAHGTSTPLNDAAEAEAIRKVFGEIAAAGHVDQGRHRSPHRRRRRDRGGRVPARDRATARCRRPRTSSASATRSQLDVVAGEPRAARARRRRCRTRSGSAVTTRRWCWRRLRDASTPLHAWADAAASAEIREIDGRRVVWFRVAGGKHHGAIGVNGRRDRRAGRAARRASCRSRSSASSTRRAPSSRDGVAALHAWGRLARELVHVSGVRPDAARGHRRVRVGARRSRSGCFDHVVMTEDAFAYVTGPDSVEDFTGVRVSRAELGGAAVHDRRTGVASLVVARRRWPPATRSSTLLSYLPDHHLADPPRLGDRRRPRPPVPGRGRQRSRTGRTPPTTCASSSTTSLDADSFLELRAAATRRTS